ncbi:MAG TPA: glycosyltransferase family 39 protein [Thermoanaerobaculia bacterium]|nr:glycosyltransferase family 39 protein [Thermoanaerobaculia bacterium]
MRLIPFLIGVAVLAAFAYLAQSHPFGTYGTETDFYLYYAPDAARLAQGEFPQSTYHGPGYALLLAGVGALTGILFVAAKWISVVAATAVVLLTFLLFSRLFSYWEGIGAALLVAVIGRLPQYAISATTDVVFLAFSLAALVVLVSRREAAPRIAASAAFAAFAYLTRYNALSLIVAILIAIVILDLFDRPLRTRLLLAGAFLLVFITVTSPWLIANARHRGSPFFNTNYLNIGKTLHPDVAAGYSGDDGLLRASRVFHSLGDVIARDPAQAASQYAKNLLMHIRGSFSPAVAGPVVPWLGLLGVAIALARTRTKPLLLLLTAAVLHYLIVGLVHWEARFHFFIAVLLSGFAAHVLFAIFEALRERKLLGRDLARVAAVLAFAAVWLLTLAGAIPYVRRMLATHPTEVLAACDSIERQGLRGARITARKPHLPYLCRMDWVLFPQVTSLGELQQALDANRIDLVFFAAPEAASRRALAPLLDPRRAPAWLQPIWASNDPPAVLYRVR